MSRRFIPTAEHKRAGHQHDSCLPTARCVMGISTLAGGGQTGFSLPRLYTE
ncbi:hypothetical protein [Prevotella denticola]|uniref:hypothetical protein n=1 Tax=Prevotella denticola TaxID=28129 RepID=UPI001BAC18FB|nr:hypothetical protein [Prevotella denticola]QUB88970.1 hypothetical protein J4860_03610 [Prevotella denticola]